MESTYKIGDVVRLKSAGPKMTVKSVGKDWGEQLCVFVTWFDEKNKNVDSAFPVETVELAVGH